MVKEKAPDKPKEPQKPKDEIAKPDAPKTVETVRATPPSQATQIPPPAASDAPPSAAPPAMESASFVFEGGQIVETSSDPAQIYKGLLEYSLRSRWDRPEDVPDPSLVAEVELGVDRAGRVSNPVWMKSSGNKNWDDSVRRAISATKAMSRPPPTNFPARVVVRFDVVEATPVSQ